MSRPSGVLLLFAISQLNVKKCHPGSNGEVYIEICKYHKFRQKTLSGGSQILLTGGSQILLTGGSQILLSGGRKLILYTIPDTNGLRYFTVPVNHGKPAAAAHLVEGLHDQL